MVQPGQDGMLNVQMHSRFVGILRPGVFDAQIWLSHDNDRIDRDSLHLVAAESFSDAVRRSRLVMHRLSAVGEAVMLLRAGPFGYRDSNWCSPEHVQVHSVERWTTLPRSRCQDDPIGRMSDLPVEPSAFVLGAPCGIVRLLWLVADFEPDSKGEESPIVKGLGYCLGQHRVQSQQIPYTCTSTVRPLPAYSCVRESAWESLDATQYKVYDRRDIDNALKGYCHHWSWLMEMRRQGWA